MQTDLDLELDVQSVKVNQHAKYLCQSYFDQKLMSGHTHRQITTPRFDQYPLTALQP